MQMIPKGNTSLVAAARKHSQRFGAEAEDPTDLWSGIGFSMPVSELANWIDTTLPGLATDRAGYGAMQARIRELVASHFTLPGVMSQIRKFIEDPERAELRCVPATLPIGAGTRH